MRLITPRKSGVQIKIEETIYNARNYKWAGCRAGITASGRWQTGPWRKTVKTDKEMNQDCRMEKEKLEEEGTNMKMDLK